MHPLAAAGGAHCDAHGTLYLFKMTTHIREFVNFRSTVFIGLALLSNSVLRLQLAPIALRLLLPHPAGSFS
jgi:hypothetical protein